jgi:AsmA protein
MRCRRFRRLILLGGLGVALAPPLLWVLVVLLAPTDWARSHVVAALEKASGRAVQIQKLSVCLGGGISLSNLRIGAPGAIGDPWLQAELIEIDVSPIQLLCGRFEPSRLDVEGATLRVLRRQDGALELSDLVPSDGGQSPSQAESPTSEPHRCGCYKLKARLRRTNVVLIDEPTRTRMTLQQVEGDAALEEDGAFMVTLSGLWNQGPFQLTMHADQSSGQPSFDGQFRCSDVVMDQGMTVIRYAVPVLAGAPVESQGRLGANVYLSGRGQASAELSKSLLGHGTLTLDPISLGGTPLVAEFAKVVGQPEDGSMGSIHTSFVVKEGRIVTEDLSVNVGKIPVSVSGWTDLGGGLDYQVRLDHLADRLPEKARQYMSSLDLDVNALTTLRLSGTVDQVTIRPVGAAAMGNGKKGLERVLAPEDRQRLKVLGRQIRDKLLR